nr:MAG TPA: small hydrophobic protein [Caudoviricetes sp.]
MYAGGFVASLKGIACTRVLSFYSRACQQAYSSFHRWRFSHSFTFTGLYMLRFQL